MTSSFTGVTRFELPHPMLLYSLSTSDTVSVSLRSFLQETIQNNTYVRHITISSICPVLDRSSNPTRCRRRELLPNTCLSQRRSFICETCIKYAYISDTSLVTEGEAMQKVCNNNTNCQSGAHRAAIRALHMQPARFFTTKRILNAKYAQCLS